MLGNIMVVSALCQCLRLEPESFRLYTWERKIHSKGIVTLEWATQ